MNRTTLSTGTGNRDSHPQGSGRKPTALLAALAATLIGGTALAQAPSPAVAPGPLRVETRRDRHPQVETDARGNLVFRNLHLVAVLEKRADGFGPLTLFPASRPTRLGSLPIAFVPELARVTWRDGGTERSGAFQPQAARISGDDRVVLSGSVRDGDDSWAAEAVLSIGDEPWLNWQVAVRPAEATGLLRFAALPLRAGRGGPSEALVPGVFFARYNETLETPAPPARPLVPNPLHLTAPVMAMAAEDTTVALLWDMQQTTGTGGLPSALFDAPGAPDSPAGAENYRMELFLPSVPNPVEPNHEQATEPLAVAANTELRLAGKLLVAPGLNDATAAIRQWTRAYPNRFRELDVKEPRSIEATRRLSRQTLLGNTGEVTPLEAVALRTEAGLVGRGRDAVALREGADRATDALRQEGVLEPRLAYRVGGVIPSLAREESEVYRIIDAQLPDGSWAEALPPNENVVVQPGLRGVGVTAVHALPVLRYAALTGNSNAAGSGYRALEYLSEYVYGRPKGRYRIPRMVQGDGNAPSLPSLYVAADVAECFLLGYQVTGEIRFLEEARFWADTGLPFIYLWSASQKPVLPGAALPVIGERPGIAEQLAGLAFARVLLDLDRYRDDDLYEKVIHSIVVSTMHQQATMGADAGTYPLHWNVLSGQPEGVRLQPDLLLSVIHDRQGYAPEVSHRRIRVGPDRLFVASGATIKQVDSTAFRLRLDLHWLEDAETITTVAGVPGRPISVEYNTSRLRRRGIPVSRRFLPEADAPEQPGWSYNEETGLLTLRLEHTGGEDELEIRWANPVERFPVDRIDRRARSRRGT